MKDSKITSHTLKKYFTNLNKTLKSKQAPLALKKKPPKENTSTCNIPKKIYFSCRGVSRTAAISEMELLVIIVTKNYISQ